MKASVVGLGNVGRAVAFALVVRGVVQELALLGTDAERARGEALDLQHASSVVRPMHVHGGDDAAAVTGGSDLIFVCASKKGDPMKSRLDLARPNAELLAGLIPPLAQASPGAIFVVLSNPLDVCTYLTLRHSGFDPARVIGTGTLLDTMRFRARLAGESGINPVDIRAYVLGEHGDSQFPALSVASAGGVRLPQKDETLLAHFEKSRRAGHEVAGLKGHTNFGVAMTAVMIAEAIEGDLQSVLPVSTLVDYAGVSDVCLSLPCVIGRGGVERVLPIDLDEEETQQFRQSAQTLRKVLDDLDAQ